MKQKQSPPELKNLVPNVEKDTTIEAVFYERNIFPVIVAFLMLCLFYLLVELAPGFYVKKYYATFPPATIENKSNEKDSSHKTQPLMIGSSNLKEVMSPAVTGPIGDTYGGLLGPTIAVLGAFITFLAFWIQYKANQQQKRSSREQDIRSAREQFDSKFLSLIEIHRNNVNEIRLSDTIAGRNSFRDLYSELRFTYLFVTDVWKKKGGNLDFITDEQKFNIAYLIFFFGAYYPEMILSLLGEKYKPYLNLFSEEIKNPPEGNPEWKGPIDLLSGNTLFKNITLDHEPFGGRMTILSHYIRHIFQIVKLVDEVPNEILNYDRKYEYVTVLRSQLSVYEQLCIYYNALSILGKPWIDDKNLLSKYCVVKSLPLPLADFYIKPTQKLGLKNVHGKTLFEWDEIAERMK
jgi:hypothetical protein